MSTSIRFVNAELVPCAIFIWNNDGSLKWHRKSDAFVKGYIGRAINSYHSLRDSATSQAFTSMDGVFTAGATVSAFFENVPHNSRFNAVLREEAIRLGDHGVLTLLMAEKGTLAYDAY